MSSMSSAPIPSMAPGKWWRHPFSMVQTNLREIDVTMDVEKVLDFIQGHGATSWLVGVGGIQAQYPTELDFHWKNPNLANRPGGDLVGDAIRAAHSRGVRLLGRMDFSKITSETAAKHPDWCYRSPKGKLQTHTGGLVSVCPSGDWYQKRIFEILTEVMTRYPIDGFFFNWTGMNEVDYFKVYHGVCHCDRCQQGWKDFTDGKLALPNSPTDAGYPQWIAFGRKVVGEVLARVQQLIYSHLPDAGLIRSDVKFHEANNSVGRPFWPFNTAEHVSAFRSVEPDAPVFVNSTCFYDMPYRMASENAPRFAQYLLQAISRGGNPSTYMMGTPGKIPYDCLSIAGEITRFHTKYAKIYDGLRSTAETALVRPDQANLEKEAFDSATKEFRGLYKVLQELHVPFEVVNQEALASLSDNGIDKRFHRMILPDLGALRDAEASSLDIWTKAGGKLLLTGSSMLGFDGAIQLSSHPAQKCTKVVKNPGDVWSSYISHTQEQKQDIHIYPGPITPIYGHRFTYEWKQATKTFDSELGWAPFAPPEKAYGNLPNGQPGFASLAAGKGSVTVIPFTPGRGYNESGLLSIRDFVKQVIQSIPVEEAVSIDIADQVEITLNRNGNSVIIHIINVSGIRQSNFASHLPIPGGSLKVESGVKSACALVKGQSLEIKNGQVELPVIDLWEVIVLDAA